VATNANTVLIVIKLV